MQISTLIIKKLNKGIQGTKESKSRNKKIQQYVLSRPILYCGEQSTDINMNKRNRNLNINHCLWEGSDLNNLVDISQEHRANFNNNVTCQKTSFKPQTHPKQINKMVPRIQQACKQNDPTMINPNIAQQRKRKPIEQEFIKQYSIPNAHNL